MNTLEIKQLANQYIINTYGDRALALVRGKRVCLGPEGKQYLEFVQVSL